MTSIEEIALLTAIGDHPDENTHRLAFADWLEENGNLGRALYIRLSIRLHEIRDTQSAEQAETITEINDLADKYGEDHLLGNSRFQWGLAFGSLFIERGFVKSLRVDPFDFNTVADDVFHAQPAIQSVSFPSLPYVEGEGVLVVRWHLYDWLGSRIHRNPPTNQFPVCPAYLHEDLRAVGGYSFSYRDEEALLYTTVDAAIKAMSDAYIRFGRRAARKKWGLDG